MEVFLLCPLIQYDRVVLDFFMAMTFDASLTAQAAILALTES